MTIGDDYINKIKQFEGFHKNPYWDVRQFTVGYGTRARDRNDLVDEAEADRRLRSEIANAAGLVDRFAPHLDPGTRAALTSLTFNAGPKWQQSGLGAAIKAGDMDAARASFLQYANADGQHLPGLANRRQQEVSWFGTPGVQSAEPAQAQTAAAPVAQDMPPLALDFNEPNMSASLAQFGQAIGKHLERIKPNAPAVRMARAQAPRVNFASVAQLLSKRAKAGNRGDGGRGI